jgi:peptidoglycan/xylan/chitin deacetylase (PgdA/CDA1 family)
MAWLKYCILMLLLGLLPVALAQTAQKTIAFTFDDLPVSNIGQNPEPESRQQATEITGKILDTLKEHNIRATGFVIEMNLNTPGARDFYAGLLEDWLRNGHLLGHHGYSHLQFGEVTLSAYEDDFLHGDVIVPLLLDYRGIKERYYRYPYNDTGDTAEKKNSFLAFLAAHGYASAPMTFENDDWMYSSLYDDALARKDVASAKRLEQEYLAESQRKIAFIEKLSGMDFHRQIPQVTDLHVTRMNADLLDELLNLFERNGYKFISMQEALADPAYKTQDQFVGSDGISWLLRWQLALGMPIDYDDDPEAPKWVQDAYTALEKSGAPL